MIENYQQIVRNIWMREWIWLDKICKKVQLRIENLEWIPTREVKIESNGKEKEVKPDVDNSSYYEGRAVREDLDIFSKWKTPNKMLRPKNDEILSLHRIISISENRNNIMTENNNEYIYDEEDGQKEQEELWYKYVRQK